jgi:multidrug efflux pump subunit AcrA (membrane-fusion protein)
MGYRLRVLASVCERFAIFSSDPACVYSTNASPFPLRWRPLGSFPQVALAELSLGYTQVKAAFDGQMGKHLIDPGGMVEGDAQQASLAEIMQLDPIYVVTNISSQRALESSVE